MKNLRTGIWIVAGVAGLIVAMSSRDGIKEPNTREWVDPAQLKAGPIRHEALKEKQLERVTYLQSVFREVDPTPLEKWIEDFRRDENPDRDLSIAAKKEVYGVVLMRSGAPDAEVLKHLNLKKLTLQDAKEIMALFSTEPAPIRVVKP